MAQNKFMSRDDWKKQKELEEMRKAGTAPAELDEEGNEINPHIPQYISQAPWYLDIGVPSLSHQRQLQKKEFNREWYDRGLRKTKKAVKYRKGACENCGAMGHKAKDCLERPRKKGAKQKNATLAADDVELPDLQLGYDGKHDRWNGYDTSQHLKILKLHAKIEDERRKKKAEELKQTKKVDEDTATTEVEKKKNPIEEALGEDSDDSDGDNDDVLGARATGDEDQVGQRHDVKTRTTVRNLRIREDTAKYLQNLDVSSAFYDPKSRSMRENPLPHKDVNDVSFAGDNFVRYTGDMTRVLELQKFAWDASEKGGADVHPQALPSQAEYMYKQFQQKKEGMMGDIKKSILEKYGGEEHLKAPDKRLLLGQTEAYVEYSRDGRIVKGDDDNTVISKWPEDVLTGNHTEVWGSYWEAGEWGYACCHQFVKNSYCTGAAGKSARISSTPQEMARALEEKRRAELEAMKERPYLEAPKEKTKKELQREQEKEERERKKKLKEALEREEKRLKEDAGQKRKYNSLSGDSYEVTDEDMEAYHLKRIRSDDPMAKLLSK